MDEREDTGVGPEQGVAGAGADDLGRADPLVEGAPVGGRRSAAARTASGEADPGLPTGTTTASPHAWVGAVTAAGLGLMVVELLVLLGTTAQGMAVERLDGDFFHKVGVAFLSNVGTANGLTILVAAVLVSLPVLVGAPMTTAQQGRRSLALSLGALLALVVVLATPLAVRARLHVLDIGNQPVDALARRVLGTYTIGTLGTAAAALGTCLGLARLGSRRPGNDDGIDDAIDAAAGRTGTAGEAPGATTETVTPHP